MKKHSIVIGLIFTIASALFAVGMTYVAYLDQQAYERMQTFLYDCGMDSLGAMVSAALYFGCRKQEGDGAKAFRTLNVFVSASFVANFLLYYTIGVPEQRTLIFVFVMLSKLFDLAMIYFFYQYMSRTLNFKGKLAHWADKGIPVLLVLENLVILSNIFYPTTFLVDANGIYQATGASAAEDVYLVVVSVVTAILIIRSYSPRSQKLAGLTFICLPLINYIMVGGTFGNASQYGMILVSLIIMYCIIFNDKSSKLAATQIELNMATEIQASMLPSIFPAFPNREEFNLYASMDPAKEVGGDFYDFFIIDDDHLGVVIADVSGKGVPAALFMMISKTVVQNFAMLGIGAAEVLKKANDALCAQNKMEMFVTTWIGILELSTGKMTCASAGHEYPAIYHDGKFELYKDKHGFVLGGMEGARYSDYELQLEKGDKIFVYTDVVPEATSANTELFGTDRMLDALNSKPEATPKEILRTVRASVDEFVGAAPQFDDLTMVCVEYRGRQ
ncbi:MAG: serine/threonine-protein phosphatase [Oscillospiraceae bacterium]|nr:serine/threonine-protein phosphatase [Oscillospiraceae bacterium]